MFKSYARIPCLISFSAIFLSVGGVSAADMPSADSIDSPSATGFVQEQDQARYRHESQLRRQVDGASAENSATRAREQKRSMEQEGRRVQTHSQQRPQPRGVDKRGMAMGGGPGGGRR